MSANNEFETAVKILKKYYRNLAQEVASDVIQNRESFESDETAFNRAEEIIERNANKLQRLSTIFWNLRQFSHSELPKSDQSLHRDEFRCFACGGVIRRDQKACSVCGWTWIL